MSPEVLDRVILVVAIALCVVVGILAAWVERLDEQLKDLRKAVGVTTGQREKPLESTPEAPRPASSPGETKLHRRPTSLASQAGVRARAEAILRARHKAEGLRESGGAA